jgi:hypothetical protein
MIKSMLLGCVLAVLALGAAFAEEGLLSWDNGTALGMEGLQFEGHYIHFDKPAGWDHIFPVEASFYGQRYGDVGATRGTLTIWGPQSEKTRKLEDAEAGWVIYYRKQFQLADVPEQPGWVTLPLDTVELPDKFAVTVFTYSGADSGIKLGVAPGSSGSSHSCSVAPKQMEKGEGELAFRLDGGEWMLRIQVRSTLDPEVSLTSEQLAGSGFSHYDDGSSDGFVTFQRFGPLVRISSPHGRTVKRVYLYGKVEGDWFNTTRSAAVFLLDSRLKIIDRQALPYKNYTNEPAWHYIAFNSVPVPDDFYVLVEPASRSKVKLWLGYDGSGSNNASYFGTVGAFKTGAVKRPSPAPTG